MELDDLYRTGGSTLSAATRRYLEDVAAADPSRPIHYRDVDWSAALPALRKHALLGLARARLRESGPEDCPEDVARVIEEGFAVATMQMQTQLRGMLHVLELLGRAGIDVLVVKGLAVAHTVYPDPSLRLFGDLDLVAREADWTRVHQVLVENGFVAREGLSTPAPKLIPGAVVQELKYWHEAEQLLIEVHFEDFLYAGLAARDAQGFWDRSRWVEVEGFSLRVLSPEDQLVHLCAHLHYDGAKRLNWFSDLAIILRDRAQALDWPRVLAVVRTEEAEVPFYYALRYVSELLGVCLPEGILDAVRPDRFRRWWHERYLPEAAVLRLEPIPQPSLSFYFQPLFRRLLPDLLIMGRRPEKARYLARLIVPSVAWLRHYYHLGPTDPIATHYVLHPLKLLAHYAQQVGKAAYYLAQEKRGYRRWAWWSFDA